MAIRKSPTKLHKVTLNLGALDWQLLKEVYPKTGASNAVRRIIAKHCETLRDRIKSDVSSADGIDLMDPGEKI